MKHKYLLVAVITAVCSSPITHAAPAPTPPVSTWSGLPNQPATPTKAVAYPLTGTVLAISATELTIKGGDGKPDRVFAMTPQTVIVNGDKPATVADVKVGQKVGGRLEKAPTGSDRVLKLNIGVKQESKPKTKTP